VGETVSAASVPAHVLVPGAATDPRALVESLHMLLTLSFAFESAPGQAHRAAGITRSIRLVLP
jgi:hypothetical protein